MYSVPKCWTMWTGSARIRLRTALGRHSRFPATSLPTGRVICRRMRCWKAAGEIDFAGHEILKHEPACGDGGVLVVQRDGDAVRAISAYRSGGLVREVEIEGDPLPLHLLDRFRKHFGEPSGGDPWMLEGSRMELDGVNTVVWSTRHPDTDELVVLLTAAGDPKIITIKGLEPGATNLDGLVAFAVASRGVRFDALKATPRSTVLLVERRCR